MELSEIAKETLSALIEAAKEASQAAYCPYSRFAVGAAVLTLENQIVTGCNVENASYGLTICAERVAVFQAVAGGARGIRLAVVYTPTPEPTTPCGACRQVLFEFGPDAHVICVCKGTRQVSARVRDLLPLTFELRAES